MERWRITILSPLFLRHETDACPALRQLERERIRLYGAGRGYAGRVKTGRPLEKARTITGNYFYTYYVYWNTYFLIISFYSVILCERVVKLNLCVASFNDYLSIAVPDRSCDNFFQRSESVIRERNLSSNANNFSVKRSLLPSNDTITDNAYVQFDTSNVSTIFLKASRSLFRYRAISILLVTRTLFLLNDLTVRT